jgi:hypothetical protein
VLVYKGDFETQKLAANSESAESLRKINSGEFLEGLLHARKAVEFDPSGSEVRSVFCVALVANGSPPETSQECETARELLERDSLTNTRGYMLVREAVVKLQSGDTPRIVRKPEP